MEAPTTTSLRRRRLVIIPAFNEERALGPLLDELSRRHSVEDIAVIDDGSRDATAEVARGRGVMVVSHPFNLGYGAALQTGYKLAYLRGYELCVQIDGDGQHDPSSIDALCAPIERGEADVTVGSRFLVGQGYIPSFSRRIGMVVFGFLASVITKRRVTDPTSGYQALSADAFNYFREDHFPFDYPDADVLVLMHRAKFRVLEVPVAMRQNDEGKSMHSGLAPLYYVFKMFLSIAMTLLREAPIGRRRDAD